MVVVTFLCSETFISTGPLSPVMLALLGMLSTRCLGMILHTLELDMPSS